MPAKDFRGSRNGCATHGSQVLTSRSRLFHGTKISDCHCFIWHEPARGAALGAECVGRPTGGTNALKAICMSKLNSKEGCVGMQLSGALQEHQTSSGSRYDGWKA